MFKNLYDAIKKKDMLDVSYEIMDNLHEQTYEMFKMASKCAISGEVPEEDLIKMDKEINYMVQMIRKNVLEHFSLSSTPNLHAGLVLISLIIDYERIGDYTKALCRIRNNFHFSGDLDPEIRENLEKMAEAILKMFPEAYSNIEESYSSKTPKITSFEENLKEEHRELRENILQDYIGKNQALSAAVAASQLRRIAGHLDNIGTAGTRPFPKLGFKPGASSFED